MKRILFFILIVLTTYLKSQTYVDSTLNRHFTVKGKSITFKNNVYFLGLDLANEFSLNCYDSNGKLRFRTKVPNATLFSGGFSDPFITLDNKIGFFLHTTKCISNGIPRLIKVDTLGVLTSTNYNFPTNANNNADGFYNSGGQLKNSRYFATTPKYLITYTQFGQAPDQHYMQDTVIITSCADSNKIYLSTFVPSTNTNKIIKYDYYSWFENTYPISSYIKKLIKYKNSFFGLEKNLIKFGPNFINAASTQLHLQTLNCDSITDFKIENDTIYCIASKLNTHFYIKYDTLLNTITTQTLNFKNTAPISINVVNNKLFSVVAPVGSNCLGWFIHNKNTIYQPINDIKLKDVMIANGFTPTITYYNSQNTYYIQLQGKIVNKSTAVINSLKLKCYLGNHFEGCYRTFGTTDFSNLNLQPSDSIILTTSVYSHTQYNSIFNPTYFFTNYKLIADSPNEQVDADFSDNIASTSFSLVNIANIDESTVNNSLHKIYPNPANTKFIIENKAEQKGIAYVYAIDGKLLLQKELSKQNETEVETQQLPNGSYTIKVVYLNKQSFNYKLLITR